MAIRSMQIKILWSPKSRCNLPLVLSQVDNLLLDHKVFRVPCQEVFELLDMLSRDVTDLRGSLGPVAKKTLDGNFSASSVLPKMKWITFKQAIHSTYLSLFLKYSTASMA